MNFMFYGCCQIKNERNKEKTYINTKLYQFSQKKKTVNKLFIYYY